MLGERGIKRKLWKTLNGGILETLTIRYRTLKTSIAEPKALLIEDSQVRYLHFANDSINSLPGVVVHETYRCVPEAYQIDTIVLVIGENNLTTAITPSHPVLTK